MKKIYLALAAALVSLTLSAERVSQDDAALVANHFMNPAASSLTKKAAPQKRMVLRQTAEQNSYYVYQNADGEGWVLIAADDAVKPVLAYSETGTFRTDNMPVNLRAWLGKYNRFIQRLEDDGVAASEETKAEWRQLRQGARKATTAVVVAPLIQTTWDQDAPYNNLCPGSGSTKAYTGCVATAMAQVMKYWEWPIQGTGSHSYQPIQYEYDNQGYPTGNTYIVYQGTLSANFGQTTYDWANMKNSYSGSSTSAQKTAVATLMYHCGVATEMMYGGDNEGGSGTYTVNYGDEEDHACAQNALWMNFGYKKSTLTGYMRDGLTYQGVTYYRSWTDNEWIAMLKAELDLQHPIMYGGAGDEGGHSFICDGYRTDNYFHFNWGWSGSNDGYYLLSNLNPGSGGAGGGGYDFSEDQDVIIGIVPERQENPDTVIWSVQGVETPVEYTHNAVLELPAAPADCTCGKVFAGWTAQANVNGERPNDLFTSANGKRVTANVTYYAVFATPDGNGTASVEKTLVFSDLNYANATDVTTVDMDNCTLTFSKGTNTQNAPKYYDSGAAVRCYKNNTLTVSSENTITKIAFTNVTNYDGVVVANVGTYSGTTWTGSSNSVTLTNAPSDSAQWRIKSIKVTTGGGASYTGYTLNCNCGGSGLENTTLEPGTRKVIYNGQVYILREGRTYTLTGLEIK